MKFRFLTLILLLCLVGNMAQAQTSTYEYVDDNLDFAGYRVSYSDQFGDRVQMDWDGNYLKGISQQENGWVRRTWFVSQAYTTYNNEYRLSIDNTSRINIAHDGGGQNDPSYLQFDARDGSYRDVNIHHLGVNDKVIIQLAGGTRCYVMSDNTDVTSGYQLPQNSDRSQMITIANDNNDGVLTLRITNEDGDYPGIRFIGIQVYKEVKEPYFDYDPGYEEYDMYDEFTYKGNNNNAQASNDTQFNTNNDAGFSLNGKDAKYITFDKSKITANNRIAVEDTDDDWRFNFGLRPPTDKTNDVWNNFSVCNLRVGDRVLVSYMGGPEDLVFSSAGNSDTYNGCAAFADKWNDGVFNEGEDQYITGGMPVQIDWQRNEGNISQTYGIAQGNQADEYQLYYTKVYVIAENGHLDFGIKNGPVNRLVKIKIYSDHQAMMVDDYDQHDYRYTAHFNISGELQMKEHIMPGGLEVHIGNDNPNQHAIVVASKKDDDPRHPVDGFVSYVNAVDGYKIPGVTKSDDGSYYIPKFDLVPGTINGTTYTASADRLPLTGTYYVFKPENNGKMKLKFKANSMNYYRWDYAGDAVYSSGNWIEQFDRPNEQTLDEECPYYLVTIPAPTNDNPNPIPTFELLGNVKNGKYFDTKNDINLVAGYTYYLYGAWNSADVFYNYSDNGAYVHGQQPDQSVPDTYGNNIEWRPIEFNPNQTRACGVAELLWVEFTPQRSIFPLAKWVKNDTRAVNDQNPAPNPDYPTDRAKDEKELAKVTGYVGALVTVKKMSGNIVSCRPYIWRRHANDQEGRLMIDNIVYAENENPGGTILIKIGDPEDKSEPLYTLTIAYSADERYDENNEDAGRGHIWDYSTTSLQGLTWENETYNSSIPAENGTYSKIFSNTEGGYAVEKNLGPYFNDYFGDFSTTYNSAADVMERMEKNDATDANGDYLSLLREEIDYQDEFGQTRSDWTFNYNLVNNGMLFDPIFVNKYDMEGDNADMIWDSEGMVFQTSSGQSGIFDEYGRDVAHTTAANEATDPDRFIGILEGGKFRIPWLEKDDRVIIYMGIGTLNLMGQAKFSIRNAYDALHNEIDPADDYVVGGSQWMGKDDPNYGGCYHFFAKGDGQGGPADMVFEMKEGSLCKIYSVQIYRGDRIITNEIVGKTENDKFLLSSTAPDPNDAAPDAETAVSDTYNWTLKYFGKNQKLADGTTQTNEVIAQVGRYENTPALTTSTVTDPTDATYNTFTFAHSAGDIGTFRMRAKDMERNMKYVADYADHNVTVAYQETMRYPYTWDFMDMTGFDKNYEKFDAENALGPQKPTFSTMTDEEWDNSTSYHKISRDLSLWGQSGQFDEKIYILRLNSQRQEGSRQRASDNIFETAKDIYGNQLWADRMVVPETQGLWFYTNNNNQNSGQWRIHNNGMEMNGASYWPHSMVVPNVPANAAVYLRMGTTRTDGLYSAYQFQGDENPTVVDTDNLIQIGDEYVFAVKNTGEKRHLALSLGGFLLKKVAVSTDPKKVNIKGYASESRNHDIDAKLLPYFTGEDFRTYLVSDPDYTNLKLTLTDIASTSKNFVLPANTGCVIRRVGDGDDLTFNTFGDGNGFHLFVPDMHDTEKVVTAADKAMNDQYMVPVATEMQIPYSNNYVKLIHDGFNGDGAVWYAYTWSTDQDQTWIPESNGGRFIGLKDKVIFVRMNPAFKNNPSWDGKWNQTEDLTVQKGSTYTITGWGSEKLTGAWGGSAATTDMTNYVLTYNYKKLNGDNLSGMLTGEEKFYRVYSGWDIWLRANSAYLQLPTASVLPDNAARSARMFSFRVVNNVMPGDVNYDETVNVADFISVGSSILGKSPAVFYTKGADVNNDTNINVSDFIGIANIILSTPDEDAAPAQAPRRASMNGNGLETSDYAVEVRPLTATEPGKQQVLSIRMKNTQPLVGYEFTILLPDGVTIATDDEVAAAQLSNARTTAQRTNFFAAQQLGNNALKVLCGTTNGDSDGLYSFTGTDGEVARITVNIAEGFNPDNYEVAVIDGLCTNQECVSMPLVPMSFNVTGISDVMAEGEAVEGSSYYNVQGQRLGNRPAQRGVYIVNGKKVTVK